MALSPPIPPPPVQITRHESFEEGFQFHDESAFPAPEPMCYRVKTYPSLFTRQSACRLARQRQLSRERVALLSAKQKTPLPALPETTALSSAKQKAPLPALPKSALPEAGPPLPEKQPITALSRSRQKEQIVLFKQIYMHPPRTPSYWKTFRSSEPIKYWLLKNPDTKATLHDVGKDTFDSINELVQGTWQKQLVGYGRDSRGLKGLQYSSISVIKVQRIENIHTFKKYSEHRHDYFHKVVANARLFTPLEDIPGSSRGPIRTTSLVKVGSVMEKDIYHDINEHYLFHGTKPDAVDTIVHQGLDSRLSRSKVMFGCGIYCAESSSKADQYSDYHEERRADNLKMFLIRVCLGDMYVRSDPAAYRRAPCKSCRMDKCRCTGNDFYDSVVGEGKWNFREFVVYDNAQVYPEYLITYQRQ